MNLKSLINVLINGAPKDSSLVRKFLIVFGQLLMIVILPLALLFVLVFIGAINPKLLKLLVGIFLVSFGVAILIYGDKKLNVNEGRVGRFFFPQVSILSKVVLFEQKWALGLLALFFGFAMLLSIFVHI